MSFIGDNSGGGNSADITELELYTLNGWREVADTWTYSSATAITVPSGASSLYPKGTRCRLKQGGSYKYFNLWASSDTALTIIPSTDYTLTNAAITDVAISLMANPVGWPAVFRYSPTPSGFSANPSNVLAQFRVDGSWCIVDYYTGTSGTSNATTFTITAPVAISTDTTLLGGRVGASVTNSGSASLGQAYISTNGGTTINLQIAAGTAFSASGAKGAWFTGLAYIF